MSSTSEPALRAARSTFGCLPGCRSGAVCIPFRRPKTAADAFCRIPSATGRPLDLLHVTLDASGVNFSIDNDGTIEVRHALTPSFSVQILSAPDPAQGPPPAVPAAPPCPARAAFLFGQQSLLAAASQADHTLEGRILVEIQKQHTELPPVHLYRLKVYPVGLQDCRIDVCPVLVKAVKPPAAGLPGCSPPSRKRTPSRTAWVKSDGCS